MSAKYVICGLLTLLLSHVLPQDESKMQPFAGLVPYMSPICPLHVPDASWTLDMSKHKKQVSKMLFSDTLRTGAAKLLDEVHIISSSRPNSSKNIFHPEGRLLSSLAGSFHGQGCGWEVSNLFSNVQDPRQIKIWMYCLCDISNLREKTQFMVNSYVLWVPTYILILVVRYRRTISYVPSLP